MNIVESREATTELSITSLLLHQTIGEKINISCQDRPSLDGDRRKMEYCRPNRVGRAERLYEPST